MRRELRLHGKEFCAILHYSVDLDHSVSKTVLRYTTKDVAHFISDLVARLDYESRRAA